MLAGLDYSSTSPAIYIQFDDGSEKWFNLSKVLSHVREEKDLSIIRYDKKMTKLQRAIFMAEWVTNILVSNGVKQINVESFSMGSRTGMVFDLGAHSGIMYYMINKAGIAVNFIPPTALKREFTGRGDANKELMCETFKKLRGFSFSERLGTEPYDNPENDLVDAYALGISKFIITDPKAVKKMFY